MHSRLLVIALAALVLTACGSPAGVGGPSVDGGPETSSPAGAWVLVDADPAIDVPADARITLEVSADGDHWQAGGTSACNSYGGQVTIEGTAWRGSGYGSTAMGCDEPRMTAEQAYLDALHAITTWDRPTEDSLVLTGPGVELRFTLLPPLPTADLVDTTWVLTGLMSGTGEDGTVSSTAPDADEATLQLRADGTMDASTGCRTFSGDWVEQGDEVLLTTFGQRDDSPNVAADGTTTCSEAVVAQENHVLSVLGDGFHVEIDGQQLTLISRDGLGLTYTAGE